MQWAKAVLIAVGLLGAGCSSQPATIEGLAQQACDGVRGGGDPRDALAAALEQASEHGLDQRETTLAMFNRCGDDIGFTPTES